MNGEFAADGKAHRLLRRLEAGPADMVQLAAMIRGPNQTVSASRQRAYNMLAALRSQGLIRSCNGLHVITLEGREALISLDYGHPYRLTPRARVFEGATP